MAKKFLKRKLPKNKARNWYYNQAKKEGYNGSMWPQGNKDYWRDMLKKQYNKPKVKLRPEDIDDMFNIEHLNAEDIIPTGIEIKEGIEKHDNIVDDFRYVNFNLAEHLREITEDNVEAVYGTIVDLATEVYNQVVARYPGTFFQIVVSNDVFSGAATFSTPFKDNFDTLTNLLHEHLTNYALQYDNIVGNLRVGYFRIRYIIKSRDNINGAVRTFTQAKHKWLEIDTNTRLNCLFIAIYTGLKWTENKALLTDDLKRQKNAEKWKNRSELQPKIKSNPVAEDLPVIADYYKVDIYVYNNLYQLINQFKVEEAEDVVEIRVANNHATSLIRQRHIKNIYPDFEIPIVSNTVMDKKLETDNELRLIHPKKPESERNDKIIAWDIETVVMPNGKLGCYLAGLAMKNKDQKLIVKQFAANKSDLENGITALHYMADDLYENKELYNGYTFYAHNGGKFDLVILIRDVFLHDNRFKIISSKVVELNNSWIDFTVCIWDCKIYFRDSLRLIVGSLKNITNEFNVKHKKIDFDCALVKLEDIDHFDESSTNPKHKEIIKYHAYDCFGLYEVIDMFNKIVFDQFKINITNCMTGASLSKKVFLHNFYKEFYDKGLKLYNLNSDIDQFIRNSYMGGRTECFRIGKFNGNFRYYDLTSSYPYAGTKPLPWGKPIEFEFCDILDEEYDHEDNVKLLNNDYKTGFIYCYVLGSKEMLKNNIPVIGLSHDMKYCFPYFVNWTPIHLTLYEVRYASKLGYKFHVIRGYYFQSSCYMKNFFETVFKLKNEASIKKENAKKNTWKIIANSGYGWWGFNIYDKDTIKISTPESRECLQSLLDGKLKNYGIHGNYSFMRVMADAKCDSNVAVASTITALARLHLHSIMNDIVKAGGNLYYCDTDSIITDICLNDHPLLKKKYSKNNGVELGELKDELGASAQELLILGCKSYSVSYWKNNQKNEINKLKGYKRKDADGNEANLDLEKLMIMYRNFFENDINVLDQNQTQMSINKNNYMDEQNPFEIKFNEVHKNFKVQYNKGVWLPIEGTSNYVIEPLSL